jgi:hypothetical protein
MPRRNNNHLLYPRSPKGEGGILFYLCPFVLPSVQDIFRRIFLSNCWWRQTGSRNLTGPKTLPTIWSTYMIMKRVTKYQISAINRCWEKCDEKCAYMFNVRSQASYRYPISWETFFDPSDSYFLLVEERGYHRWALAHSSIRSLPSIGAEKNVTKNVHICSMWIETN